MKQLKFTSGMILFLGMISLGFMFSCAHDATGVSEIKEVSFECEVLPIFQSNCTMSACHNSSDKEAEFDFSNYDGIMKAVTPNEPKSSEIYNVITDMWFVTMPPSPHNVLSKEQRTKIAVWIEQGAKNTKCN